MCVFCVSTYVLFACVCACMHVCSFQLCVCVCERVFARACMCASMNLYVCIIYIACVRVYV